MGSSPSKDQNGGVAVNGSAGGKNPPQYGKAPPPPRPPKTLKKDVFKLEDHKHVDDHVIKAPQKLFGGTFRELVTYLCGNPEWDDLAKVRALFRWVTSVDVYSIKFEEEPPKQTPLEYFYKIQHNQGNHAHLLSGLLQMSGIPCMILSGMNKSAAYEIGKSVDRKTMGAQWNAVFCAGEWRFIDAFWASACVVGRRSSEWALVDSDGNLEDGEGDGDEDEGTTQHRINEFYFLPDPDKLIWTHFPDEKNWQLLEKPVSQKDFQDHFYVRERFYIMSMDLMANSKTKCVVDTQAGEIDLPFAIKSPHSEHYRFKYMLYKSRKNVDSKDLFLDRFVFFEHTADMVHFALRFPIAGTFKMDIYGLDIRDSDVFDLCCTYLINCKDPKKNCLPLPDCPPLGWGPVGKTSEAGLEPITHKRALVETKDGMVEIRFKAGEELLLHQYLKHAFIDEATLSKYAVTRQEGDEVVVTLRLPQQGEYALKLFAQGLQEEGLADNVCNYLIKCDKSSGDAAAFPNMADGKLGPSHMADKFGVKAVSHKGGTIEAKDGKASVKFKAKDGVELVCELHTNDPNAASKMATATKNDKGEWTFDLDLPASGEYSLNVFAKTKGSNSQIYNVHSYLIKSSGREGGDVPSGEAVPAVAIPTETVETSDGEILIPVPPGCEKAVAAMHRRNAQDPPGTHQLEFISQEDMNFIRVDLKDYGEYMLNVYDVGEEGRKVTNVAKYQINRRRPGELYDSNLKTVMENLGDHLDTASATPDPGEDKTKRSGAKDKAAKEKRLYAQKQIQRAMELKDERQLEAAIAKYRETGPPADDPLLKKAETMLRALKAKADLMDASQKRDIAALDKALKAAKEVNTDHSLDLQIALASRLRDHLAKIEKLRHDVMNMEQRTISEIKTYSNPPDGVHQAMMATFMLLGHSHKEVKVWRTIQALMGKTGKESLMRKVSAFDAKTVPLPAAQTAKKVLEPYTLEQIRQVSAGASTFYVWAKGMIGEVESYGGVEASDKMRL